MKRRGLLILLTAFICWGLAVATPAFAEYGDINQIVLLLDSNHYRLPYDKLTIRQFDAAG